MAYNVANRPLLFEQQTAEFINLYNQIQSLKKYVEVLNSQNLDANEFLNDKQKHPYIKFENGQLITNPKMRGCFVSNEHFPKKWTSKGEDGRIIWSQKAPPAFQKRQQCEFKIKTMTHSQQDQSNNHRQ